VRVVRLPFVPTRIAVTSASGFIVVHGSELIEGKPRGAIAVSTINEVLI
jgi:hypothetical protein